jgi:hypothetical protein
VELLSDIEAPWRFLNETAPKEPDDLFQLPTIIDLTRRFPLLLSMDLAVEEVVPFWTAFGDARGIFFRLGGESPDDVLRKLGALRSATGLSF